MIGDQGIPQGAVVSHILMNVFIHELDLFVLGISNKNEMKYGRYVDDCSLAFTINSEPFAMNMLNKINHFLNKELRGL